MRRVAITLALLLGSMFLMEAYAQEGALWQMQQAELEREFVAVNKKKTSYEEIIPEQVIGSAMMQEQEGKQEGTRTGDPDNQEELPVPPMREDQQETSVNNGENSSGIVQQPAVTGENPGTGISPVQPVNPGIPGPVKEARSEDSVLEFNFLYFLIQKFKLSEIME